MRFIESIKKLIDNHNIKRFIIPSIIALFILASLIVYSQRKTVTVILDKDQVKLVTYSGTVQKALENNNIHISPKDSVVPVLSSKLSNNETITIKRAVNIKVLVDSKELNVQSPEESIEAMLKAEGIVLNTDDKIKPDKKAALYEGMQVDVIRVESKTITEAFPVNFKEVIKRDSSLPNNKRNIIQEGKEGEKQVTTRIVYENGKEVSRTVVNETISIPPVDKVIVQGTYPLLPVSADGAALSYSRMFKAKTTAYWAVRGVGRTYTASGRKAVRDPDSYSTIAVDHDIIPYGTKLFVEGYGFAIAADTGTSIIGDTVDVFFDTYDEACSWGLKYVNVYILK